MEDHTGLLLDGRFRLERLLGVGGMGSTVWLAQQISMSRAVAIKLLPSLSEVTAQRFEREARIAASLRHPNIVTIFDYGQTDDGKLFLVMEYLEGKTLEQALRCESTISLERTCSIARQVLRALSHAHEKRVIHRDLKPSNLFLSPTEEETDLVTVLDFGLAKTFGDGDEDGRYQDVTGQRQTVCGTPTYMSPEQWRGQTDHRTDLYALGVIMFRMLAGRAPFIGGQDYDLFHRVITEPIPAIANVAKSATVPPDFESIVRAALAKKAQERYPSARVMRTEIEAFLRGQGDSSSPRHQTPSAQSHPVVERLPITIPPSSTSKPGIVGAIYASGSRQQPMFWMAVGAVFAIICGLMVSLSKEYFRTSDGAQSVVSMRQDDRTSISNPSAKTLGIGDSTLASVALAPDVKSLHSRAPRGLPPVRIRAVESERRRRRISVTTTFTLRATTVPQKRPDGDLLPRASAEPWPDDFPSSRKADEATSVDEEWPHVITKPPSAATPRLPTIIRSLRPIHRLGSSRSLQHEMRHTEQAAYTVSEQAAYSAQQLSFFSGIRRRTQQELHTKW